MADIFSQIHAGEPVDMRSPEYQPVIKELHRADDALFRLNHTAPRTSEQATAWNDLFDGQAPQGVGYMAPIQIDFPK